MYKAQHEYDQALKDIEELEEVQRRMDCDEVRKYILGPLQDEEDELKNAYDCNSLAELRELKGKKRGLNIVKRLLNKIDKDIDEKRKFVQRWDEAAKRDTNKV